MGVSARIRQIFSGSDRSVLVRVHMDSVEGKAYCKESEVGGYESKKMQFNDYVRFLQEMAEKEKINLRGYENLFRLVSVLSYEKKIDFAVTDKERSALIDELSRIFSKDALNDLVSQSIAFKSGKISSVEFYAYLKKLALDNNIDLAKKYPNLYNYIIYNSVYSKIDNEKLFNDIKTVENNIKGKLFTSDGQRTLDKLSRNIDILLGMVNIKLLNGDFSYYQNHRDEFTHEAFTDFIKKEGERYGLAYDVEPPTEAVAQSIPKLEDFYAIATKRDKALVDNTIKEMDRENQQIAVLVTGGFHSEGMGKLLEKEGVSYIVVCPSITKDVPTPYIQILTNQRTPIEDILANPDTAKKGMLAPFSRTELVMVDSGITKELAEVGAEFKKDWVARSIEDWFKKVLPAIRSDRLARDPDTMKAAYATGMRLSLANYFREKEGLKFGDGKLSANGVEISRKTNQTVDAITKAEGFDTIFDRAYTAVVPKVEALPIGNLIGKITTEDGCVVDKISGRISSDGTVLTLTDLQEKNLGTLTITGKISSTRASRIIESIKESVSNPVELLTGEDAAYADSIIKFLVEKAKQGKIYLLAATNEDTIMGFSDGDNIFISECLVGPRAMLKGADFVEALRSKIKSSRLSLDDKLDSIIQGLNYQNMEWDQVRMELCNRAAAAGHTNLADLIRRINASSATLALFHEGGEGYFVSHTEALKALEARGLIPHIFLRGVGYTKRHVTEALEPEALTTVEQSLLAGLGLQDRIFGEEANNRLSRLIALTNDVADLIERQQDEYAKIAGSDNREKGYRLSYGRLGNSARRIRTIIMDPVIAAEEIPQVAKAIAFGKGGIFRFWEELNNAQKRTLIDQVKTINIEEVERLYQRFIVNEEQGADVKVNEQELGSPKVHDLRQGDTPENLDALGVGEAAFKGGKVAILELAGGTGSRLKYFNPKIMLNMSQVMNKSMGRMRAEKIRALAEKYGRPVPWLIMTSDLTHKKTVDFFDSNVKDGKYFDQVPKEWVKFVPQRVMPLVTNNGEYVLGGTSGETDTEAKAMDSARYTVAVGGFGHGDARDYVLGNPDIVSWLKSFGIEYVMIANVDNSFVAAARSVGYHIMSGKGIKRGTEHVSFLVVEKSRPDERVGLNVLIKGRNGLIEYNQIPPELAYIPYIYMISTERFILYKDNGQYFMLSPDKFLETMRRQGMADPRQIGEWVKSHCLSISDIPADTNLNFLGKNYKKAILAQNASLWLRLGNLNTLIWSLSSFADQEYKLKTLPVVVANNKETNGYHPETGEYSVKVKTNKFECMDFHGFLVNETDGTYILIDRAGKGREGGFAPVKEKTGIDTPERATKILSEYDASLLTDSGWFISPDAIVELSPAFAFLDGRDLTGKIGAGGVLNPGSQLYLSGRNTVVGKNLNVTKNNQLIVRVDEEYAKAEVKIGNNVDVRASVSFVINGNGRLEIGNDVVFAKRDDLVVNDGETVCISRRFNAQAWEKLIKDRAYYLCVARTEKGIPGSSEDDWKKAESYINEEYSYNLIIEHSGNVGAIRGNGGQGKPSMPKERFPSNTANLDRVFPEVDTVGAAMRDAQDATHDVVGSFARSRRFMTDQHRPKGFPNNSDLEDNFQKAINGDDAAYKAITKMPKEELMAYFESKLQETMQNLPEDIFGFGNGYDVRGNAQPIKGGVVNLTPANLYVIGKLMGTYYANPGDKALITGDIRNHTPILRYVMALGAVSAGVNVEYAPDYLTTGAHNLLSTENEGNYKFMIQVSGSHGVPEKNGFKIKACLDNKKDPNGRMMLDPLYAERLEGLYWKEKPDPKTGNPGIRQASVRQNVKIGELKEVSGLEQYVIDMLDRKLPAITKDEIVVIDPRAGAAGPIMTGLLKKRGFEIIDMDNYDDAQMLVKIKEIWQAGKPGSRRVAVMLNMQPDGRMSRGIWDPSKPEAVQDAQRLVNLINANLVEDMPKAIGSVFDGDADRITAILEDGRGIPAFEMTLPYYQRFLVDEKNQEVMKEIAKAGGPAIQIVCDVRANSKLLGLIDRINAKLQAETGIKDRNIVEGSLITTGYPPQLGFMQNRIGELEAFVNAKPELRNDQNFMKDFAHFKATYFTAEASGHNFFHISERYPDRVCDCAIAGFMTLLNIRETMLTAEVPAGKPTVHLTDLFSNFPVAYSSNEIRVPIPNAIKVSTAREVGKWMKKKYEVELKPYTEPVKEGDYLKQPKDAGYVTVAGFKIQLKDGRSALVRWSNTGEELTTIFEGHDWASLISIMEEITDRLRQETGKGVNVANLDNEIKRLDEIVEAATAEFPQPENVSPEKRVVMGISGGEGPGVNCYFAEAARQYAKQGYSVEVVKFGLAGLMKGKVQFAENKVWINWQKSEEITGMPGAYAGTSRINLSEEEMFKLLWDLSDYCKTFVLIGGNDHLGEAKKIANLARDLLAAKESLHGKCIGYLEKIIGEEERRPFKPGEAEAAFSLMVQKLEGMLIAALPKTIDRDTRVYPIGSITAAERNYELIARSAPVPLTKEEIAAGKRQAVIFQSMGRSNGNLAAANHNPTYLLLLPEWGEKVTWKDIRKAVSDRLNRYGVCSVVVSEGFGLIHRKDGAFTWPIIDEILATYHNPVLQSKYKSLKTDLQGNPLVSRLVIADFIATALASDKELGLVKRGANKNLSLENPGYSFRAAEPNELDRRTAKAAVAKLVEISANPDMRREAIANSGVCIAADVHVRTPEEVEATMKAIPLRDVTGKISLQEGSIIRPAELDKMPILGREKSRAAVENLPDISEDQIARNKKPEGFSFQTAQWAVDSQAESMYDMARPHNPIVNLCVIARRNEAEENEIIRALSDRNPEAGTAARYTMDRTGHATLYITSDDNCTLSELVKQVSALVKGHNMANIIIADKFGIRKDDSVLQKLMGYLVCKTLVENAQVRGNYYIFGARLVDLITFALSEEINVSRDAVRHNILGESLNKLPGEEQANRENGTSDHNKGLGTMGHVKYGESTPTSLLGSKPTLPTPSVLHQKQLASTSLLQGINRPSAPEQPQPTPTNLLQTVLPNMSGKSLDIPAARLPGGATLPGDLNSANRAQHDYDNYIAEESREMLGTFAKIGPNIGLLEGKKLILAYDTKLAPEETVGAIQAGEHTIQKYLGDSLIEVRGTGQALVKGVNAAISQLKKNEKYVIVTIASDGTISEVTAPADRKILGKIINVKNSGPDTYIPIIGLYDLALRIAFDDDESVERCLLSIATFKPEELREFLKDTARGFISITPAKRINMNEAREAYEAAEQALRSL